MKTFDVKMNGKTAEILFYDPIGERFDGITAKGFAGELKRLGKVNELYLHMNSDGGDAFEGMAIYNMLKRTGARIIVEVDGIAASAASLVAMAGDTIRMRESALMMIHNPWGMAIGTASELRDYANHLDKLSGSVRDLYAGRTKQDPDQIAAMMADETWMTGDEAMEHGFADEVTKSKRVAAYVADGQFKKTPRFLLKPKPGQTSALDAYKAKLAEMKASA